MINSREIVELHKEVRKLCREFLLRCKARKLDVIITSTYRDKEAQGRLYAKGRSIPGVKVTYARPGYSYHNWRVAFDIVPIQCGKPVWDTVGESLELWKQIGQIGKDVGLEWGGDWHTFREFPHFQYTEGLTIQDFMDGKTLKEE